MRILMFCLISVFSAIGTAQAGDSVAGKQKAEPCIACHGDHGTPAKAGVPKIDRMSPKTFVTVMKKMREAHHDMPITSHALSDKDLEDIAAYLAFSS